MLPAAQKGPKTLPTAKKRPKILSTAKKGPNSISAASGGDEGPQRDPPPTFYPCTGPLDTANPS